MVKIINENIIHYISDEVSQELTINLNRPFSLLSIADMAIDKNNFSLLKYRYNKCSSMRVVELDANVYYIDNDIVLDCYVDIHSQRDVEQHAELIIDKVTFDVLKSRHSALLSKVA